MKRLWIAALAALAVAAFTLPSTAFGAVTYPDGVASGDVTTNKAMLWTRVSGVTTPTQLVMVEVFRNPSLRGWRSFIGFARTSAARDWTVKIDANWGLKPDSQYWYRFRTIDLRFGGHGGHGDDDDDDDNEHHVWGSLLDWWWNDCATRHHNPCAASESGTFRTPPKQWKSTDVEFTYTADSDPYKVPDQNGANPFNNWETLAAAQAENGKFFIYLGDTIYADSSNRPGGPATTLPEYREAYRFQRSYANLRNLLKSTSTYPLMDDHEVQNDYDGQTVDPARYAAGRQAFLENMPIREKGFPTDPTCAGNPLYRTYKWGKEAELFVLDERSCRSADVEAQCNGDLGPTLPPAVRQTFPYSLFLTPSPTPACTAALNDPSRTMLGPVQKAKFKQDLRNSTATHKFVISELAMQQFYALPYDRWEGYPVERSEILNFIRSNGIDNVEFLTTDNHATLQNEVFIDNFSDPQTIALEAVTGPIATNTLQNEVLAVAGPVGLFVYNTTLNLVGMNCRHLDKYSYGHVDVNALADTATVSSKDSAGVVVTDQQVPIIPCVQVSGP